MYSKTKLVLICLIFVLFNIAVVSASDINSTDLGTSGDDAIAADIDSNELNSANDLDLISSNNDSNLMESDNDILNQNLKEDTYKSNESVKVDTKIVAVSTKVIKGCYFHIYLKDSNNTILKNMNVIFTLDKVNYNAVTNSKGIASLKITKNIGTYPISVSFKGNDNYNAVSKSFKITVPKTVSIVIGNDKLLSNGYLKIYLKSSYASVISGKYLTVTVGNNKKYTKKTNSEGVLVVKPNLSKGTYLVTVSFAGTSDIAAASASKNVTGIKGNARSPFISTIPLKNGVPDLDYMTAAYVMGDGNAAYTLLKSHYLEVIKRDSYCLFLNKKLTKYVFFKTKSEPKYMHMIVREKWNVIERAINTRIVLKNKYNYFPVQITVNLKGKSYTYPEVRDEQDTGYTCGPTSCSMCSQVLRNYVNEWHLGVKAGTNSYEGSSTSGLKRALEKFNMKCTYYYKSSFDYALKHLKAGGCALVFHTWGHYVAILDISKDGKKVLVGNPSGDYDHGSHKIPTNWLTVNYMKTCFNNYDTSGLIVKLNYKLSKVTQSKINKFYSNMGAWTRANTNERIPQL